MTRPVHFTPDVGVDVAACGVPIVCPIVSTWIARAVTCRRPRCRDTAQGIVAHEAELHARAAGARLVFLDFDGVLNHLAFFRIWPKRDSKRSVKDAWTDGLSFDRACVARVNGILDATVALVVVSSSWGKGQSIARMQALLGAHGFTGTIVGITPDRPNSPRGREIRAYLDTLAAPPAAFVILDDEAIGAGLDEHVIGTDFERGGLTDEKAAEALARLGGAA